MRKRFSEEQLIRILKESETLGGIPTKYTNTIIYASRRFTVGATSMAGWKYPTPSGSRLRNNKTAS